MSINSNCRLPALILALPFLLISSLAGCHCPERRKPAVTQDDDARLKGTAAILSAAKAKKVWTDEDQRTFNQNVAHLSFKSRFDFSRQLTGLITSQAVLIAHSESDAPPPTCACVPGQCVPTVTKN